jgi:serine/threonine-protein kinase
MPITSTTSFMDALREYHILEPEQLEKLNRAVQGRSPEPRALAQELLKRGWMTPYQANQVLQGRGAELVLGPYVLLERLGEGGMGEVFKARHQLMNRIVAIKVIRKERLNNPDAVQRFHREIRMAASLDHPHLVRSHDAAQVGDTHFLVMEYAEGVDLHRVVQKSGPLPVGQACMFLRQAALGLQHAHERGLVHRDIKPSNLQVTDRGATVKVLDMGLARSRAPEESDRGRPELTQACTVMGTPDYIAPEQIADPRKVDIRADIYSLGCTFYYMLAGRPPFPDGAWEEKLVCHRKVEPTPIEQIRPDVPAGVGAVLRKMMAKRPEDRFAAPAAVADALTPFCGMSGAAAVPVMPAGQPGMAPPSWNAAPGSTIDPAPSPTLQTPPGSLPLGPTMLIPSQHPAPSTSGPSAFPSRNLILLGLAGGGVILGGLMLTLIIVLWPKGGASEKKSDNQQADNVRNTSNSGKGTDSPDGHSRFPPPSGPVLEGGEPRMVKKMAGSGGDMVSTIFFMPNGRTGVSRRYGYVYVWDLTDYIQRPSPWGTGNLYGHGQTIVSPDGKRIAASSTKAIELFHGKTYNKDGPPISLFGDCTAMMFSPDSTMLVTAEKINQKGRIRFWDAEERDQKRTIELDAPVVSVAFSLDGQFLAVSNGSLANMNIVNSGDKKMYVYRAADGQLVRQLEGHPKAVAWASFFADGKRLASVSPYDGTLRVWNVDETDKDNVGKEVRVIQAGTSATNLMNIAEAKDPNFMTCATFWPWGRMLTAHLDGGIVLWDMDSGEKVRRFKNPSDRDHSYATALAISPDGHHALAAYNDSHVYLFRLPPPNK